MAQTRSGYGRGTGKPHPVDVHVGSRIRVRRTLLGMTQTDLAKAVGLTFQQVQKYERGVNRIGASRLFELSQVLNVPVDYFFEGLPPTGRGSSPASERGRVKKPMNPGPVPMAKRETLGLVRSYYKIRAPQVRNCLLELAKAAGRLSRTHG